MEQREVVVDEVRRERIGEDQVRAAFLTLNKYKAGKANLEKRIVERDRKSVV